MQKELLIFGSNGALGSGVTKVLTKKDYDKIYLFDFHPEEKATDKVKSIKIDDLTDEANVIRAFSDIKSSKKKAYFLFSAVGGFAGGNKVWETDTAEWHEMINKNLITSFNTAKHFAKLVEDSHSGSICFTSAFVGINAETGKAAYGASKGALIHLVKTLAKEGQEIKLTANAIAPYIIDTPANREWIQNADYENWTKPSEIGELVHGIFSSYNILSGNLLKLKGRFSVN